jgi:hypothetical protein
MWSSGAVVLATGTLACSQSAGVCPTRGPGAKAAVRAFAGSGMPPRSQRAPAPTRTYGTMGGMRKTTVYLPEGLKSELARAAVESGRSEADLIREGIELVTGRVGGAEPRLPLFESGDPDLARRVDEYLVGFGER